MISKQAFQQLNLLYWYPRLCFETGLETFERAGIKKVLDCDVLLFLPLENFKTPPMKQ